MKVLIIGSGISGMMCAIRCAMHNIHAVLISPSPSERSQSVMAAGGINAVVSECEDGDSVDSHIADTLKGGSWLGGQNAVTGLCIHAEEIIRYLVSARNKAKVKNIKKIYESHFANACSKSLSCMDVCPMHIETIASIGKMNK